MTDQGHKDEERFKTLANQNPSNTVSNELGFSPKGESRSSLKGLCYREKNFVIFVDLTLKCVISLIWKIFNLPSWFASLENGNFCRFSPG